MIGGAFYPLGTCPSSTTNGVFLSILRLRSSACNRGLRVGGGRREIEGKEDCGGNADGSRGGATEEKSMRKREMDMA